MPNTQQLFGRDLLLRVLSSAVMAPAAIALVWLGGLSYLALLLAGGFLAVYEWVTLCRRGEMTSDRVLLLAGVPYVSLTIFCMWFLREAASEGAGRGLTFYLLFTVWSVDIGAYFAGRLIGGPKLAPRYSPSKTWAGLFGGMAAAGLLGYVWAFFAGAAYPEWALALGPILAIVAQTGDIMESALKRRYGVKDSGALIPGHGGILDRIDGLLLAAPLFVLLHVTIGAKFGWW